MRSLRRTLPLVLKSIVRSRARSLLTVFSVALAMFLFTAVDSLQRGVRQATEVSAKDTTLVVYREDRYCPFSSQLPESYQRRIESIPHVSSAVPVRVLVSNCRTSLDVVTFRGVPEDDFVAHWSDRIEVIEGSLAEWRRRQDAAIVGESLAERRRLQVGDRFTAAGISVYIAGVLRSPDAQDRNVAYTHLPFLQEVSDRGGSGGVVTQFNVTVDDPVHLDAVARAIDAEFAADQEPTTTSPEKAFVARAASDLLELVEFAGLIAWAALAAVLALVANAIVLAVQERVRDHAVLQTLGFRGSLIARLILLEGAALGLVGGAIGAGGGFAFLSFGRFSLTMEGQNVEAVTAASSVAYGLLAAGALGALAGLVPAFQASRRDVAACFRSV